MIRRDTVEAISVVAACFFGTGTIVVLCLGLAQHADRRVQVLGLVLGLVYAMLCVAGCGYMALRKRWGPQRERR